MCRSPAQCLGRSPLQACGPFSFRITLRPGDGVMKKLTLEIDALRVETFDVEAIEPLLRGTVHGQGVTRLQSNCASCGGDCSSYPYNCFCTEVASCRCQ